MEVQTARRGRSAAFTALACLSACVLATVAELVYSLSIEAAPDLFLVAMLAFPFVGALVASRQPSNSVGWILLGVGLAWSLPSLLSVYGDYGLEQPGTLPRPDIAIALYEPTWIPPIGLMGTFLILLFPDGHLPSARWRKLAWLSAAAMTLSFVVFLFAPTNFEGSGYPEVENPLGIESLRPVLEAAFGVIALIPVCIAGSAAGLIQRFRRARGRERLQLKWLAAAGGAVASMYLMFVAAILPSIFSGGEPPAWTGPFGRIAAFSFVLIPIAIGAAILRHRLYDIDLIINRTLVYGLLTATLTGAYLLVVTLLQSILRPVTGPSELAVAGSTLAVAALFRPARVRIQAFIDRRFFRSKYDAARTVEAFTARLRGEIDLEAMTEELAIVVRNTLEPTHLSLWLRSAPGRSLPSRTA